MPAADGPSTGKSSAALASTGAPQGGTRDAISQWRRPVVAAAEVRKGPEALAPLANLVRCRPPGASMRKPSADRHGQARIRVVKNFKRAKDLDNGQKWIFGCHIPVQPVLSSAVRR
jgi:hypothetical protein